MRKKLSNMMIGRKDEASRLVFTLNPILVVAME